MRTMPLVFLGLALRRAWVSRSHGELVEESCRRLAAERGLTPRETEVLKLLAQG